MFVTMDVTFFELNPYFPPHLQRETKIKIRVFAIFSKLYIHQMILPQPWLFKLENPIFIIWSESGSSILDTETASLPTVPLYDVHDSIMTNKGETVKKVAALVPFDIVYSR